jgi:hypothetical protein
MKPVKKLNYLFLTVLMQIYAVGRLERVDGGAYVFNEPIKLDKGGEQKFELRLEEHEHLITEPDLFNDGFNVLEGRNGFVVLTNTMGIKTYISQGRTLFRIMSTQTQQKVNAKIRLGTKKFGYQTEGVLLLIENVEIGPNTIEEFTIGKVNSDGAEHVHCDLPRISFLDVMLRIGLNNRDRILYLCVQNPKEEKQCLSTEKPLNLTFYKKDTSHIREEGQVLTYSLLDPCLEIVECDRLLEFDGQQFIASKPINIEPGQKAEFRIKFNNSSPITVYPKLPKELFSQGIYAVTNPLGDGNALVTLCNDSDQLCSIPIGATVFSLEFDGIMKQSGSEAITMFDFSLADNSAYRGQAPKGSYKLSTKQLIPMDKGSYREMIVGNFESAPTSLLIYNQSRIKGARFMLEIREKDLVLCVWALENVFIDPRSPILDVTFFGGIKMVCLLPRPADKPAEAQERRNEGALNTQDMGREAGYKAFQVSKFMAKFTKWKPEGSTSSTFPLFCYYIKHCIVSFLHGLEISSKEYGEYINLINGRESEFLEFILANQDSVNQLKLDDSRLIDLDPLQVVFQLVLKEQLTLTPDHLKYLKVGSLEELKTKIREDTKFLGSLCKDKICLKILLRNLESTLRSMYEGRERAQARDLCQQQFVDLFKITRALMLIKERRANEEYPYIPGLPAMLDLILPIIEKNPHLAYSIMQTTIEVPTDDIDAISLCSGVTGSFVKVSESEAGANFVQIEGTEDGVNPEKPKDEADARSVVSSVTTSSFEKV